MPQQTTVTMNLNDAPYGIPESATVVTPTSRDHLDADALVPQASWQTLVDDYLDGLKDIFLEEHPGLEVIFEDGGQQEVLVRCNCEGPDCPHGFIEQWVERRFAQALDLALLKQEKGSRNNRWK